MSNSLSLSAVTPSARRLAAGIRETCLHPAVAVLATLLLLGLCTDLLVGLRGLTHAQRPYTILYLVPVAFGAAFLGVRGGVGAAALALVLARVFLFNDAEHGLILFRTLPTLTENIEFGSLAVGTLAIALVTGRLRETLTLLRASHDALARTNDALARTNDALARTNAQLVESERGRRQFNRDVLLAVTGGKLQLVEPGEALPERTAAGDAALTQPLDSPVDASLLRQSLRDIACAVGLEPARAADLCTGVTEAATNAIKHGGGGVARVWATPAGVLVEIADRGAGIAPAHLARATLEAGYSTRVSLGMGFHIMLQVADMLALCTGEGGTTVLLKVGSRPRPTEQDALLARYASV